MTKRYFKRAALGDFVAKMGIQGLTSRLSDVGASRDRAICQESAVYDVSGLWSQVEATNKDDKMFHLWRIFAR